MRQGEWLSSLQERDWSLAPVFSGCRPDKLPVEATATEPFWEPQAAVLGRLAWRAYEGGRRDDLWKLAPVYLRPSYAEEKAPGAAG